MKLPIRKSRDGRRQISPLGHPESCIKVKDVHKVCIKREPPSLRRVASGSEFSELPILANDNRWHPYDKLVPKSPTRSLITCILTCNLQALSNLKHRISGLALLGRSEDTSLIGSRIAYKLQLADPRGNMVSRGILRVSKKAYISTIRLGCSCVV